MTDYESATYVAWEEYWAYMREIHPKARPKANGPYGKRNQKAFWDIATWCVDNGINVRDYVRTAIPIVRATCRTLLPRDLTRKVVRQRYAAIRHTGLNDDPEMLWLQQETQLRQICWLAKGVAELDVLRRAVYPFVHWFRIMYPEPFDEQIMEVYGEAAWSELKGSRNLRDYLRRKRTATFNELEARIARFGDEL